MNGTLAWTGISTPLGPMILAAAGEGLAGAWFAGQRHFDGVADDWLRQDDNPFLEEARRQLVAYFAGRLGRFDLPLAPAGTAFQRRVWQAIATVAFGATRGYGRIAADLGQPAAARAVGAATGRNPISVIIPCHRLVGARGDLTGYAGGVDRKRALLAWESGGFP